MAKVKINPIGLFDMLYFKSKPKKRDKIIKKTKADDLIKNYEVNIKAQERHPNEQMFVIDNIIDECENTKTYVLRKKDGKAAAFFRAGQYVVVRVLIDGKLIARPISISSSPAKSLEGIYELTVKRVEDGFLSKYIHDNWKIGEEVKTSGPQGTFYYEGLRDADHVVAAAGGSGITPLLSMAQAIVDGDEDFNLYILFGCKTKKDIIFEEKFAEIRKQTDKVNIEYILSDEDAYGYKHGFISSEVIKSAAPKHVAYSLFAAGPQSMYEYLDAQAKELGLINKYYRKELFGSVKEPWKLDGYPKNTKDKVFNLHVKMCNKEYDIKCRAKENMMVALERAGIAGPNRCRGGICGWCRSRLLDGDVFIPEDTDGRRQADKEWGYIHPCASFALSDCSIEMPNNK